MSRQSMVDDIFQQLAQSASRPRDEKRRHPRHALRVDTQAMINLAAERYWIAVTLRDVSPGGIGLISPRLFYVGEFLVLRLEFTGSGNVPKHVLCQVRACRYCGRRLYQIGVEFKDAIAAQQQTDYFPDTWFHMLQAAQEAKSHV